MDGEADGPVFEREMTLPSNNMLYMGFYAGYSKRHKLLPMLVHFYRPRICLFGCFDWSGCFGRISATFVSLVSLDCAKETADTLSDLASIVSTDRDFGIGINKATYLLRRPVFLAKELELGEEKCPAKET